MVIKLLYTQMQQEQQDKMRVDNFFKSYGFDPEYGYNVPENYSPKSFKKQPIMNVLLGLSNKIRDKQVCELVKRMPSIELNLQDGSVDGFTRERDCYYLHGLLTDILQAFIAEKRDAGCTDSQIVIPYNLCAPLVQVCKALGIKYGMCGEFYCNWKFRDQSKSLPDNFQLISVTRVYHFTQPEDQLDEDLFFGGSMLGSFYLFKSIKLLYKLMLKIEEEPEKVQNLFIDTMATVLENVKRINISNMHILNNLTQNFLAAKLRKYLRGFKDLILEGMGETLTSGGGAGGFDPCFQVFERAIGITFEGPLSQTQQVFRSGFTQTTRKLISDMQKMSPIKQYSEYNQNVKKSYNSVVKEYSNFYTLHRQFIQKFVIEVDPSSDRGVGGIKLSDIQTRNQEIKKQVL